MGKDGCYAFMYREKYVEDIDAGRVRVTWFMLLLFMFDL